MSNKKNPILESISPNFGDSVSIQMYPEATNDFAPMWHFHPEIEIVYVNGGHGKRHIGNHISHYSNGDLVVLALIFLISDLPTDSQEIRAKW